MSGRTLVLNARDPEEIRVALAEDLRLLELRCARPEQGSQVGSLCLGVVLQVEPGLDAAFVDYGGARAGFLHVGNVHPGYAGGAADPFQVALQPAESPGAALEEGEEPAPAPAPTRIATRIEELLRPQQQVLVQILRDPARGKGATLSTYVALAGRLLVLMPSLGRAGVSRRIEDAAERQRLRALLEECPRPPGMGVIARTAAVGASAEDLQRDLEHLLRRWGQAAGAARAPGLLLPEESPALRAARDLYGPAVTRVVADDEGAALELEQFLRQYAPGPPPPVERYRQSRPLFEALELERDFQLLYRSRVPLPGGGSIVLHETEALTAIDVNSGRIDKGSLEETAWETNRRAAAEIARQIRLRDLGGIVVVDFIDLLDAEHRRALEAGFRAALAEDRARVKPGRLGSFGLFPLTRRRQGNGLARASEQPCRHCGGSGSLAAAHAGALRVLRRLRGAGAPGLVRVHPSVAAVLCAEHAAGLAALAQPCRLLEDAQVPPGEPVFELEARLAAEPGQG